MADWKTLSSEKVYETRWFKVRKDQALNHKGQETTFSVIQTPYPAVSVIATNSKGEIFMQRNFRYPVDKMLWDIPSGGSDGQEPLEAAKRELLEEAGLESENWIMLGDIYSATGMANIPDVVFWAQDARSVTDLRDDEEFITDQQFMSITDIERLIRSGGIVDSSILSALYLFKLHREA